MTDWKFTGERPPLTDADWAEEFSKYKKSPEWLRVNQSMTVEEFKFIYFVEYMHRMWGRTLGVVFAVPAAFFLAKKCISGPLGKRLGIIFLMGGAQGFVGWWMVKSGLQVGYFLHVCSGMLLCCLLICFFPLRGENPQLFSPVACLAQTPENDYTVPRVSPYRLAMHLMSAFSIYALLVWTTMSVAFPEPIVAASSASVLEGARKLRFGLLPLSVLVAVTAASGAFVAGLEAGHAYNTFPLMDGNWIPAEYFAIAGWRNFFENTAAVQFNHRLLALTTLASTGCLWLFSAQLPMHNASRLLMRGILTMTLVQVGLGVATLLNNVPVYLGALHQSGALVLFTLMLATLHSVRSPNPTSFGKIVGRYGPDAIAVCALSSMGLVIQYA